MSGINYKNLYKKTFLTHLGGILNVLFHFDNFEKMADSQYEYFKLKHPGLWWYIIQLLDCFNT